MYVYVDLGSHTVLKYASLRVFGHHRLAIDLPRQQKHRRDRVGMLLKSPD